MFSSALLPMALHTVPLALQGTAVGVFGSFENFGLLVGPILIGAIYAVCGVSSVLLWVTGVCLVGVVFATALSLGRPRGVAKAWESPSDSR